MPDTRTHRGPAPKDDRLFGPQAVEALRCAVADYSLLLTKGYAEKSALKLVGDRLSLTQRQRIALARCACSDNQLATRRAKCVDVEKLTAKPLAVDGYNLLITIESALSGAFVFVGRDGCCRDLASIHGTYRKVAETIPALGLIANFINSLATANVTWFLDKPVSNSGRLKALMLDSVLAGFENWTVELVARPDADLVSTDSVVATSDSAVLDACRSWTNIAAALIAEKIPSAKLVDFSSV